MIKTSYLLKNAIGRLVLPPGLCLLLLACAVLMWRRYPRFARYLCGINVLILLLLSLPAVSIALRQTIEPPPLNPQALAQADAIVGLGGGTRFGALETSDGRDVSEVTLQRVRYTASLARRSGLPVAFTGGAAFGEKMSEAELMARSYHDDFGMQARWVENTAFDTGDNARFTAQKNCCRAIAALFWFRVRGIYHAPCFIRTRRLYRYARANWLYQHPTRFGLAVGAGCRCPVQRVLDPARGAGHRLVSLGARRTLGLLRAQP